MSKLTPTPLSACYHPPPAEAAIDVMSTGWVPWTHPCCSSACSTDMHSHAANQPEQTLATHWGSDTANMAFAASMLSVWCPGGSRKAKVGCRLSRFAVKQMYITYRERHMSLTQTVTSNRWLVCCRRPSAIHFCINVLWHRLILQRSNI